jgi:outer membrane protein TolC
MKTCVKLSTAVLVSLTLTACSVIPTKITDTEKQSVVNQDVELIRKLSYLGPDPVLSISDVLARAVIFNKDGEIASLELKLADIESSQAYLSQLPTLVQRLNYDKNNEYQGSNSASFENGELIEPSRESYLVSSKKETFRSDLTLTMNLLDFGVALGRAERLADEVLIAREKERQAIQTIIQQTENLYWRVVAAQKLDNELEILLLEVQEALEYNAIIMAQNLQEPLQNLTFERELLDVERTLMDLRRDLSTAKIELDRAIGVKPGTAYRLVDVEDNQVYMPKQLPDDMTLETIALLNRADLTENLLQQRILKSEKESAVMKLMPQVQVSAGYYRDNSPYSLNNDWATINPQISWDLLQFFRMDATTDKIALRNKLLDEQRLQITLGILAVLDSSKILLTHNLERYVLANKYTGVSKDILQQLLNAMNANRNGGLVVIKEKLNLLLAEHRKNLNYSEIRATVGQTIQALGLDLVPEDYSKLSVNQIAAIIDQRLALWYELPETQLSNIEKQSVTTQVRREDIIEKAPTQVSVPVEERFYSIQLYSAKNNKFCAKFFDQLPSDLQFPAFTIEQNGFCKVRLGPFVSYNKAKKHIRYARGNITADSIVVKSVELKYVGVEPIG